MELRIVPRCLPAVLQLREYGKFQLEKMGSMRYFTTGFTYSIKVASHHYSSIFLGRWSLHYGHPSKHSVPHGKLVAYKSYIKVIKLFKFIVLLANLLYL